jgi:hypothetical protein
MENDGLFTNDVVLIVLNDESKTKDGPAYNEENEYEMSIMTNYDI